MSTRCQIGFYEDGEKNLQNFEALIYRHCDGYPDSEHGVIATVVPILKGFDKERGLDDIEYASAWLVKELKTDVLNIGICKFFHVDIEYFYAVYPDRLDVYETTFGWNSNDDGCKETSKWLKEWKKIESVSLKD